MVYCFTWSFKNFRYVFKSWWSISLKLFDSGFLNWASKGFKIKISITKAKKKHLYHNVNDIIWLHDYLWQVDDGDFMLVEIFRCWWHLLDIGIRPLCYMKQVLAGFVTDISNLPPTNFQHPSPTSMKTLVVIVTVLVW